MILMRAVKDMEGTICLAQALCTAFVPLTRSGQCPKTPMTDECPIGKS